MFYTYGLPGLIILVLDVLVLISLWTGTADTQHKLLWTIVILLLPLIGLILYWFIGRSSADRNIFK